MQRPDPARPSADLLRLLALSPANPDQPVDARWRIASEFARGTDLPAEWTRDAWVARALAYVRALLSCRTEAARELVAGSMPDIAAAHRLHESVDKLTRGILEARLLAGQTFEEAAAACGLSRAAVEAYHELFFSVRDKLQAEVYILGEAIGEKLWFGLTEEDVDVVLKHLAYLKGPIFLEAVLPYFRGEWSIPERLEGAGREQLERLACALQTKALFQVRVLPFPQCLRVLRLCRLVQELWEVIDVLCPAGQADPRPGVATWEAALPPILASCSTAPGAEASPTADPAAWWPAWRAAVLAA
jgi:hypothetical protein